MPLLDIFSKKKVKEDEKITIIIDHREKNSSVASELMSLGFKIEFKSLPIADYIVKDIAIERKSISDFKSSIINKRIFSQLLELKQYPKNILIIEGITEEDIYKGIIHENAFRGFILLIILEYQVPIVFTQDSKDTAKYISVLAKKGKNKSLSLRASKILLTKEEQIQFILEGIPNIGPVKAKKLLEKFKTIKNIINASEEEIQPILGKRTKEFRDLLIYEFNEKK